MSPTDNRPDVNGRKETDPLGKPGDTPPTPRFNWFFLLSLIMLVYLIFSLFGGHNQQEQITYTQFFAQLTAGNVKSVQFDGDEIQGALKKAITQKVPATPFTFKKTTTVHYKEFSTVMPPLLDPELLPTLKKDGVVITATAPSSPWIMNALNIAVSIGFILLIWFWFRQSKGGGGMSGIFGFGQSRARLYTEESPRVGFGDVAGEEESKQELTEIVDFLKHPQKYHKLGGKIPKGVLLVGPPGTGKTLLARAVAGEAGVPFFSISASEFVEMFVGVGASRVRDLFSKAKTSAPSIIFLDEIDAVGRQRGAGLGGGNDEREQTLNQLLVEMDGFDPKQEVIVIAATNRPDVLDPALLRPGRFDRQVTVGLPDRRGREGILKIHSRGMPIAPDVNLVDIARGTPGMSGADLANLVNEAALLAARRNKEWVEKIDFEDALDKIVLGVARSSLMSEEERRTVAYHEAGHAVVALLSPEADPVHKVTIIPHGMALGVTEQLPEDDRRNYPRDYLEARLTVMMGGRSAEENVLNQMTTGAENDLKEATRLARRMVTEWGMSERVGTVAYRTDEHNPFLGRELAGPREYSEATAAMVDDEVRSFIEGAHAEARRLLKEHRNRLDMLVDALLREETVGRDRLAEIMGADLANPPTEDESEPKMLPQPRPAAPK
ncbi:MAG TPA: ATP-dependent zinc metalloprotease FtsH [Armatimonadota bacterium]|nr:ATP-dependent zinc metalloprotease FtsH [Armatimonadota bacterium]